MPDGIGRWTTALKRNGRPPASIAKHTHQQDGTLEEVLPPNAAVRRLQKGHGAEPSHGVK